MRDPILGYVVVLGTLAGLMWISWIARAKQIDDFYVAGRRVKPVWNGMAIGADWISAASFISMAGAISALGYGGLAYIMGWTGGYVLLALVLAPYLRKFGRYTTADFVGDRYESQGARLIAILCAVLVSFVYCVAQMVGCGIIMSRLLGISMNAAVAVGAIAIVVATLSGGMKSITSTQCARYLVLIIGFLLPVTVLCIRWYGHPFPQFAYGDLLARIAAKEKELGITQIYGESRGGFKDFDTWVLTLTLMVGTAGLPHIMARFYTTPTISDARRSAGWALVFIGALYITAPAYAAFQKWVVLDQVVGKRIAELPAWLSAWSKAGLLTMVDSNADGILQYAELSLHRDIVVLSMPEAAQLPYIVFALVAAGGLAAAIATADGLLTVIASAISQDLYGRTVNPGASEASRMTMGRILIGVFAVLAGFVAAQRVGFIIQIVGWAFSLAAATFFPVIVTGVFWRRANKYGAIAGMLGGLLITCLYVGAVKFGWPFAMTPVLGITDQGAGFLGMIFNFASCLVLPFVTPRPSENMMTLVDRLRLPKRISV